MLDSAMAASIKRRVSCGSGRTSTTQAAFLALLLLVVRHTRLVVVVDSSFLVKVTYDPVKHTVVLGSWTAVFLFSQLLSQLSFLFFTAVMVWPSGFVEVVVTCKILANLGGGGRPSLANGSFAITTLVSPTFRWLPRPTLVGKCLLVIVDARRAEE